MVWGHTLPKNYDKIKAKIVLIPTMMFEQKFSQIVMDVVCIRVLVFGKESLSAYAMASLAGFVDGLGGFLSGPFGFPHVKFLLYGPWFGQPIFMKFPPLLLRYI